MSTEALTALCSAGGFVLVAGSTVWVSGRRWGKVKTELGHIRQSQETMATKADLKGVCDRLERLEPLFEVRLKAEVFPRQ